MKTVHLFNCDNVYLLETVEDLLHEVEQELPFNLQIQTHQHIFQPSDMEKFNEEVKTMNMDYAVFVIHANEPCHLSAFNNDEGYGCIFQALSEQFGGKVLVVIAGDTNYKKGEENQSVISEWTRHKISSQFAEESMDGTKSFVFSWEKKHNPIHYYAIKHFLEDERRKFELTDEPKPKIRKRMEEEQIKESMEWTEQQESEKETREQNKSVEEELKSETMSFEQQKSVPAEESELQTPDAKGTTQKSPEAERSEQQKTEEEGSHEQQKVTTTEQTSETEISEQPKLGTKETEKRSSREQQTPWIKGCEQKMPEAEETEQKKTEPTKSAQNQKSEAGLYINEQETERNEKRQRNVHLFNCDNLYPLGTVEELIHEVEKELPFKLHIEHHIFKLADLRKTSEKVKNMEMDYAVFVVHAKESRLSINEKDAGIGYACVFKKLIEKTSGKVLVVIGGDTYYKGEENQSVISEWAKYKISSQFPAESMDGTKSFVFSWNKKHNPIHYYALKHFFEDEGRKFEMTESLDPNNQKTKLEEEEQITMMKALNMEQRESKKEASDQNRSAVEEHKPETNSTEQQQLVPAAEGCQQQTLKTEGTEQQTPKAEETKQQTPWTKGSTEMEENSIVSTSHGSSFMQSFQRPTWLGGKAYLSSDTNKTLVFQAIVEFGKIHTHILDATDIDEVIEDVLLKNAGFQRASLKIYKQYNEERQSVNYIPEIVDITCKKTSKDTNESETKSTEQQELVLAAEGSQQQTSKTEETEQQMPETEWSKQQKSVEEGSHEQQKVTTTGQTSEALISEHPKPWIKKGCEQKTPEEEETEQKKTEPTKSAQNQKPEAGLNINEQETERNETRQRNVHLINCDNIYPLGTVEDLVHEVEKELPFKLHIERHIFRLADLRKTSEEVKNMEMDYAVFVVHANEFRLSINEKDAGIGYACIFKKLIEKTSGKVLVVIGEDTYYKGEEKSECYIRVGKIQDFLTVSCRKYGWYKEFRVLLEQETQPYSLLRYQTFFEDEGRKFEMTESLDPNIQKTKFEEEEQITMMKALNMEQRESKKEASDQNRSAVEEHKPETNSTEQQQLVPAAEGSQQQTLKTEGTEQQTPSAEGTKQQRTPRAEGAKQQESETKSAKQQKSEAGHMNNVQENGREKRRQAEETSGQNKSAHEEITKRMKYEVPSAEELKVNSTEDNTSSSQSWFRWSIQNKTPTSKDTEMEENSVVSTSPGSSFMPSFQRPTWLGGKACPSSDTNKTLVFQAIVEFGKIHTHILDASDIDEVIEDVLSKNAGFQRASLKIYKQYNEERQSVNYIPEIVDIAWEENV